MSFEIDQQAFIEEYFETVKKSVLAKLNDIPSDWDGSELRQYIADKFAESINPHFNKRGKRWRDFRNDVIVRNL